MIDECDLAERGSASLAVWIGGALVALLVYLLVFRGETPERWEPDPAEVSASPAPGPANAPEPGIDADSLAPGTTSRAVAPTGFAGSEFVASGFLVGRVVTSDGAPVGGARVIARKRSFEDTFPFEPEPEFDGEPTNARGEFRLRVPSGVDYEVGVKAGGGYAPALRGGGTVYEERVTRTGDLVLWPGGVVFGRATDLLGNPIAGVRVKADPRSFGIGETMTDEEGRYRLRGLALGDQRFDATADGLIAASQLRVAIRDHGGEAEASFVMYPVGSISGRVVDERGAPLERAVVVAEKSAMGPGGFATTDSSGRFTCASLSAAAEYELLVAAPGYLYENRSRVSASPDGSAFVEVMLRPAPSFLVFLRDEGDGSPIREGSVSILDPQGKERAPDPSMFDYQSGGGLFRRLNQAANESGFSLPGDGTAGQLLVPGVVRVPWTTPGRWRLRAGAPGYQEAESDFVMSDGTGVVGPIELALQRGPEPVVWHGLVVDAMGEPVPGASVGEVFADGRGRMQARYGVPTVGCQRGLRPLTDTDESGRFSVSPTPSFVGEEIGVRHLGLPLAVAGRGRFAGSSPDRPVVLRLVAGGVIEGIVTDAGAAKEGHPVVLWNEEGASSVVRTDAGGAFVASKLAPGRWWVAPGSVHEAPSMELRVDESDPMVSACRAAAREVEVTDGEVSRVELELDDFGATIRGSITFGGAPRGGLRARLSLDRTSAASASVWVREAQAGDDGAFVFSGVPSGEFDLSVTSLRNTLPYWTTRRSLVAGERYDVSIEIETAVLTGRLIAPDGAPVERATISVEAPGDRVRSVGVRPDGTYHMDQLPATRVLVTVVSPEYGKSVHPVDLGAGPNRFDVRFAPAGALRVVLANGTPAAVIQCEVERAGVVIADSSSGKATLVDGAIQLDQVSPGPVHLRVVADVIDGAGARQASLRFVAEGVVHSGMTTTIVARPASADAAD